MTLVGLLAPLAIDAKPAIPSEINKGTKSAPSNSSAAAAKNKGTNTDKPGHSSDKAVGPKVDVWVLEQQNNQIGKMTVYASQNAMRMRIGNTGGNIIAKAPDWRVVAFNTQDKTVFEVSYDQFIKQELPGLLATTDYFQGRKLKPEPLNFKGWSALKVTAPTPQGNVGMMMPSYSGVGKDTSKATSQSVTVIASKDSPADAHAMAIIKAIFRLPKFGGFPLFVVFNYTDGSTGVTLRTFSMAKEKVATSFFTCNTKGFERVRTAEAAVLSGLFDSSFMETP